MKKEHHFWNAQPVDVGCEDGLISEPEVRKEPSPLPTGFLFEDLHNTAELSTFLEKNYVEDVHEEHVLAYSVEFLDWMLNGHGSKTGYNIVLRLNEEMVGFGSAKEHVLVVRGIREVVVSVNLLCVSKNLRGRGIAILIIKEIIRRLNMDGIYQAVFTSGTKLFFELSGAYYYHRVLNSVKLFETRFCEKITHLETPEPRRGTRLATKEDTSSILRLFGEEAAKYMLYEEMDVQRISYCFLSEVDIVCTYVHEANDEVVEFGSFFILETIEKKTGKRIKSAYLYYRTSQNLEKMVSDLMSFSKKKGCDVFTCLDIMGNNVFLRNLCFERGTGFLRYYLYNWRTEKMNSNDIFFVLH